MKMVKPSDKDIDAAGLAMAVLNNISSGYYPSCSGDGDEDAPTFFDPDDPKHLRLFYDLMNNTLDDAPGWPTRVIGGMCYVVMFDKNQIVDPDADCLELHPRFAKVESERDALRQQREELLNLLATALPYVEDAEESPLFRAGVVKKVAAEIRSAIAKAEGATP
jgi:hypothetical protein